MTTLSKYNFQIPTDTKSHIMNMFFVQSLRPGPNLFNQLSKILRLSRVQEIAFGLALLNSTVPETRKISHQFVKLKFNSLLVSYSTGGNYAIFNTEY